MIVYHKPEAVFSVTIQHDSPHNPYATTTITYEGQNVRLSMRIDPNTQLTMDEARKQKEKAVCQFVSMVGNLAKEEQAKTASPKEQP